MNGKREFNIEQKWDIMAKADAGKRQAEHFHDMMRDWIKEYGDLTTYGLAGSAQNYFDSIGKVLGESQQDIQKLYDAAAEVEKYYAEKFENIAFEMSLYASRIKALRSVLQPPGSVANPFEAPDFGDRLEHVKREIVENEINVLIANPDKLEHFDFANRDVPAYIGYISDKYRGKDMFNPQNPLISDIERDLLVMCYEYLHPENSEKMNAFLGPVIQDGKYAKDIQNIKYLAYASPEPYSTILFNYLPQITIADYEWAGTQHYHNKGPGLLPRFFPGIFTNTDVHPALSVAINLADDPRGSYVTFFHELGHAMDDMMRKDGTFSRAGSGLQDLLYEDTYAKIEATIKSIDSAPEVVRLVLESFKDGGIPVAIGSHEESVRNDVIKEYRDNLVSDPYDSVIAGQSNQITDVLGGYTGNQLRLGGFGHENDYWNGTASQSSEFFAHYFCTKITEYDVKSNLMDDYFKESTEFLDRELADVADALRK
jgi:hypothetical protein